ncbi:MAG: hypothetical protein QNJ12_02815 [Ilumatobacter sp.]|uniref:hypothetical protein n=1 Tax=Ilumatobacter sp. TaxID=1967498 RepID=UPI0026224A8F|nr:hypothetical protein [Ilumatobacter sp.]MDJ0767691.1 hypothetical protein [Ilumatobacter sp.]
MSVVRSLAAARRAVAVRRVVARYPWLHWLAVLVVAAALSASVLERLDRVDAAAASWGSTSSVWMATRAVGHGEPVAAELVELPDAVVPEGAVIDGDFDVAGTIARQHIAAGEIVMTHDVAVGDGPTALVPPGWLAVPVVESPPSSAGVGDRVVAVSDGFVIADDIVVTARVDDVTLVAVPADAAPLLPAAAEAGSLTLLLRP